MKIESLRSFEKNSAVEGFAGAPRVKIIFTRGVIFVGKRKKICYNRTMQKINSNKQGGYFSSLIGVPTPAKASGLTFSLATVAVVVASFAFMLVLIMSGLASQEGAVESDWYLYCSYLITPLAFACVAWGILRWTNTPIKEAVKSQKCHPKYFLIAVLMQVGLLSLSELNSLFLKFLAQFGYQDTPILLPSMDGFGFIGVLFVVAVLPAVFEEVIFRGLLLKGLRSFGTVGAILLCGGLFALYHQNPAQTIYQFCCGAAFAFVALKSGSILPTVLSHFINNALILILTKFGATEFSTPVFITILIVSVISLISAMVWLFLDKKPMGQAEKGLDKKEERKRFWTFALVGIAICALTWLSVLFTGM